MKEKVKIFLDSDTLEKYLLGDTTKEETLKAERYITMYPEVRETYNELQDNLETFAKMYARKTPEGLKEIIVTSAKKEKWYAEDSTGMLLRPVLPLCFLRALPYSFGTKTKAFSKKIPWSPTKSSIWRII